MRDLFYRLALLPVLFNLFSASAQIAVRPQHSGQDTFYLLRPAIQAGVATIEHGDGGTAEIFALIKEKGIALCPTLP
ncbi:MAG TPA: hypothetical protein VHC48_24885 [Puia sp.]|nr:hypothetical protein [Puia sp.]